MLYWIIFFAKLFNCYNFSFDKLNIGIWLKKCLFNLYNSFLYFVSIYTTLMDFLISMIWFFQKRMLIYVYISYLVGVFSCYYRLMFCSVHIKWKNCINKNEFKQYFVCKYVHIHEVRLNSNSLFNLRKNRIQLKVTNDLYPEYFDK